MPRLPYHHYPASLSIPRRGVDKLVRVKNRYVFQTTFSVTRRQSAKLRL